MKTIVLGAALLFSMAAHAQLSQSNGCVPGAANCTGSNQNSGDTSTTQNYGDTHSTSSQLGNSSASNVSGNNVGFDNRAQTTQNANNTTTGTISGGNTSSGASSIGNSSSNDNRSSVGNTSSNSGGNSIAAGGGDARSSVGNTSATGGAGGSGGKGGAGGSSVQGQGQQQGQTASLRGGNSTSGSSSRTGDSTSGAVAAGGNQSQRATGGNASANGSGQRNAQVASVSNGGTNTNVGGTSFTDNSRTDARALVLPPMVPPTPPSAVAVGNIVIQTFACGPLKAKDQTPIVGTYFGFFTNDKIDQGFTDTLVPFRDPNGDLHRYFYEQDQFGRTHIYGSQVVMAYTVVSIAGARNFAMGGGAGVGPNGQIGGGSSAAMSQLVVNIQIADCEVGMLDAGPIFVPPPLPELPATPAPHVKKKKLVARRLKDCDPVTVH